MILIILLIKVTFLIRFLGEFLPLEEFNGYVIAIIYSHNDFEDKLVVSKEQIEALVEFQGRFFDSEIIVM